MKNNSLYISVNIYNCIQCTFGRIVLFNCHFPIFLPKYISYDFAEIKFT